MLYTYNFDFVSENDKKLGLGARHGGEIPYVFNATSVTKGMTADELKLRDEMHSRWVNFIKTGDPNKG